MTTPSTQTPATTSKRPKPGLRRLAGAAALLAVIALAATGCGGSNSATGSTSGGTSNTGSSQQSGVAYANCMRSHGVTDFPDNAISSSSGGTQVDLPSGIRNNPDFQSASQACQPYLPRGTNGGSGGASSPAVQAEINFSNCMRSHGVTDFPEPDSSGHMIMQGGSGADLNPDSPTFQSAMQACQSILQRAGLQTSPGGGS